jgi:ureidoglycolate lyase
MAAPRVVRAAPLTPQAFAPYGQVLMALGEEAQRHEFAAQLRTLRPHATLNMAFILTRPAESAPCLSALERHPFSSQSFVPVDGTRYLVSVCPAAPDGEPEVDRLAAFVAEGTQAVNYNPDVWHAPQTVLNGPGTFIMLRWDLGNADDTELRPLAVPIELALPA